MKYLPSTGAAHFYGLIPQITEYERRKVRSIATGLGLIAVKTISDPRGNVGLSSLLDINKN